MTEHTPRPWAYLSEPWYCGGRATVCTWTPDDGHGLALAHIAHDGTGNYDGQLGNPIADARLMAAAPDLLEALRAILHPDNDRKIEFDSRRQYYVALIEGGELERGLAAIAKATGKDV